MRDFRKLNQQVNEVKRKLNSFIQKLSAQVEIIQSQLELIYIYMNSILGEKNKNLSDYFAETKRLRNIVTICSFCKKIRDAEGNWSEVEANISKHSEALFSHGVCPECGKLHYGDFWEG